jgi:hypothetical protein
MEMIKNTRKGVALPILQRIFRNPQLRRSASRRPTIKGNKMIVVLYKTSEVHLETRE